VTPFAGGDPRLDIAESLYRYARAVDYIGGNPVKPGERDAGLARAKEMLTTCMTDDVRVRLYFEGPAGEPIMAGPGGVDGFGDFVRAYFTDYSYVQTFHEVVNIRVTPTGYDEAKVFSYINSNHWMADGRYLSVPIEYDDLLVRTADGVWRIKTRDILTWQWWVADGYFPAPTDPSLARPDS
jgi:hypothetical protein